MKKTRLPPGPKTGNPLGHLFAFRRDSLAFLRKVADKYGDIAQFRIGPARVVLVNHPDHVRDVLSTRHHYFIKGRPLAMAKVLLGEGLLTSDGAYHARQSRIIQPAFHREMVTSYAEAMTGCARQTMGSWADGAEVDMLEEMVEMSTVIAGKALFHADLGAEAAEINRAFYSAMRLFGRVAVPFSEWLLKLPLPSSFRFRKAKARLDQTIKRMIEQRRGNPARHQDVLTFLLGSPNGEGNSEGLSDRQIRDEAITLLLTAFDTTSLALTWTWYLLAQHPEVESELHAELDRVLDGRIPTANDLPQLPFTRSVFGEALRLYPPIYLISREVVTDFPIGDYVLPARTQVLISPYLIHRDPRFHPKPEKFDPEGWDRLGQGMDAKYTFFPFGRGPRSCIGESFAWMEGMLVLATLAQYWKMNLVAGHPVEYLQLVNLRPRHGMRMILERRK